MYFQLLTWDLHFMFSHLAKCPVRCVSSELFRKWIPKLRNFELNWGPTLMLWFMQENPLCLMVFWCLCVKICRQLEKDKGIQTVLNTHKLRFTIRKISETAVTSLYLLVLITVMTNVHVSRKRGCARSTFLKRTIRVRTSSHCSVD
jgi:hypothetical protein